MSFLFSTQNLSIVCEMGMIMSDTTLPYKDVEKVKGIALNNVDLFR